MFLIVCGEYKSIKRQGPPGPPVSTPAGIPNREDLGASCRPQVLFSELYAFYVCANVTYVCECKYSANIRHHMDVKRQLLGLGLIRNLVGFGNQP